jgi:hypothetical protein
VQRIALRGRQETVNAVCPVTMNGHRMIASADQRDIRYARSLTVASAGGRGQGRDSRHSRDERRIMIER